ncbi:MAG: T9SS type A sorting domain-containing protein [Bacteroidetes bacterium]|nr:T9SS type A sorting domain-containing protein [Bacteroidota bacterium]
MRKSQYKLRVSTKQKTTYRKVILSISMAAIAGACFFMFNNLGTSEKANANPGKDGAKTITALNTILNEFTSLTSNASAGATTISVSSSSLNANSRFSSSLSAGDLILIIQMQGASITTSDNSSYGNISNYNNCGKYEYAKVTSVPNSTSITLANSLLNSYTSSGKVQVVRVPRYTNLTINSGASITTDAWDGTIGGIVAIEVVNDVILNGSINVNYKGFRGGSIEQNSVLPGNITTRRTTDSNNGAEKGESIAGPASSLSNGRYGRGAPANGGGGGNAHNAAGGGGSNSGVTTGYTGTGNPDISVANWITAWNLESAGFALTTSPGGGRGGYTYSQNGANPITKGPGHTDWGGDNRNNVGGFGGRPLDYSSGRIFMGGGGGAGDSNNNTAQPAGNGGGIVFLLVKGNVSGTGSISANGQTPASTQGPNGRDGSSGGGGGGTVLIYHLVGSTSGISIEAAAGQGGSQNLTATSEAEGAGGGGGGGYVAITNLPPISISVAGGVNGTSNSSAVTAFIPNGATSGAPGLIASLPLSFNPYSAGSSPLPVVLKSFAVEENNEKALLIWETASEINNDYFILERSWDGNNFEFLGQVKGSGTTTMPNKYSFTDDSPLLGISYYRLTQIDFNGEKEIFPPRSFSFSLEGTEMKLLQFGPNPFIDEISLLIQFPNNTQLRAELFTIDGKKVWETEQEATAGRESYTLNPDIRSSGVYHLRLSNSEGKSLLLKLVKR